MLLLKYESFWRFVYFDIATNVFLNFTFLSFSIRYFIVYDKVKYFNMHVFLHENSPAQWTTMSFFSFRLFWPFWRFGYAVCLQQTRYLDQKIRHIEKGHPPLIRLTTMQQIPWTLFINSCQRAYVNPLILTTAQNSRAIMMKPCKHKQIGKYLKEVCYIEHN